MDGYNTDKRPTIADHDIRVDQRPYFKGIDIYIVKHFPDEATLGTLTTLNFEKVPEGHVPPPTPLNINFRQAQELMNGLWNLGIRPNEGLLPSHQATEKHLNDMRKIVGKYLDLELK